MACGRFAAGRSWSRIAAARRGSANCPRRHPGFTAVFRNRPGDSPRSIHRCASTLPLLLAAQPSNKSLDVGLHVQHDVLVWLGVAVEPISFGSGIPRACNRSGAAPRHDPTAQAHVDAGRRAGVPGGAAHFGNRRNCSRRPYRPREPGSRGKVFAKPDLSSGTNTMNSQRFFDQQGGWPARWRPRRIGTWQSLCSSTMCTWKRRPTHCPIVGKILGHLCSEIHLQMRMKDRPISLAEHFRPVVGHD